MIEGRKVLNTTMHKYFEKTIHIKTLQEEKPIASPSYQRKMSLFFPFVMQAD